MSEQESPELQTALSAAESHKEATLEFVALAVSLVTVARTSAPSVLQASTEQLRALQERVSSTEQALQSAKSQLGPDDLAIYSTRARLSEGGTAYYELVADQLVVTLSANLPSPTPSGPTTTDSADSKPETNN